VQVETAASTTGAVVGTRFDVPLATRVEERVSDGLPASSYGVTADGPQSSNSLNSGVFVIRTTWVPSRRIV
jgi:hypothetical protein